MPSPASPVRRLRRLSALIPAGLASAVLALLPAGPARAACALQKLLDLPVTMVGMQPTVPAKVNGHEVQFLIDSGAFFSALSPDSAKAYGVGSTTALQSYVKGVGGAADLGLAYVDTFTLQNLPLRHMPFTVIKGAGAGIIGRNVLAAFDVEYDLGNGVVRLIKERGCGSKDSLAYWSKGAFSILDLENSNDTTKPIIGRGAINGQRIRMVFDTGAPYSTVTLSAAARAGATPKTPGAEYAGRTWGIGPRRIDTWIVPVDSFSVGDEQVKHTRLRIGAIELDQDMLLGADFFLSHRVLVSNTLRKVYFTYNGGPVFRLDRASVAQLAQDQAEAQDPVPDASSTGPAPGDADTPKDGNAPKDAAGFARRAAAEVARRDFAHAVADFDRSVELDPANAQTLYDRGMAHSENGQPLLALADLDATLKLKPDYGPALLARSALLATRDPARARADLLAASRASTDDPAQSLRIALMSERLGALEDGVDMLDRWIAANPKAEPAARAVALNARCWRRALLKTGLDQALADCNAALKLEPGAAFILDSRGHVHLDRGEYDLAIADYDAALRLRPKLGEGLYARGVAKLGKGLKPEGEADIQAALAIDPTLARQARRLGLDRPGQPPDAPGPAPGG